MQNYDKSLSAEHISTNLRAYEAARSGFFSFIIDPKINNILKPTFKGTDEDATAADRYAHAQEYLELNVIRFDPPQFDLEVLRYRRGNEEVKFAGTPTFSEGNLVIDDIVGMDTKGILNAWKNKAYNPHTRKGGRMVDYKFDCTVIEYTQDYTPVRKWKLFGCWPSAVNEDPFDKENDGKRQVTAVIQYDRGIMLDIDEA